MPAKAALVQGVDYKVTNIVERGAAKTATATIDASGSKYYYGVINSITYDLYPVDVASVELTLDRSTVLLDNDYAYNTSTDAFGNEYLSDFVEENIKITSAKITFKDKTTVVIDEGDINDTFIVGYANAEKTGNNARVMVRFKDGKSYPTETLYFSEGYTVMVKQ